MSDARRVSPLIVGIGGTIRGGSSSESALMIALNMAERLGARIESLTGSALALPMYNPQETHRSEEALRFLDLLRKADGVLLASPGYHGSLSGLIKNALDYVEDLRDEALPYLEGKVVGCIVCATGWQATTTTLIALRSIVHALRGWPTPLGATLNTSKKLFAADGICIDAGASSQLEIVSRQVVEFASMSAAATQKPRGKRAHARVWGVE